MTPVPPLRLSPDNMIVVSAKDFEKLLKIIDDPSPPNPALLALALEYREALKSGKLRSHDVAQETLDKG